MLNRFFISIGILVGGINLIWFGCKENGASNRRNPVWGLVDGFVSFESGVLHFVFWAGIAVLAFFIVAIMVRHLPAFFYERMPEAPQIEAKPELSPHLKVRSAYELQIEREEKEALEKRKAWHETKRLQTHQELKEKSQKSNLSPAELKEKAIQDLLRR